MVVMKKQQIKQLALSIVEQGEVSSGISQWILNNLQKRELKLFINYLSRALKESIVVVKYAGDATSVIKNKIQKMFPAKKLVYVRDDEQIGAGIKIEFGDYILDYTVTNMIIKIMKSIRESL